MSFLKKDISCKDVSPLLIFYVCNEVSEQEQSVIESHLPHCADCTAQLADERRMQEIFKSLPQTGDDADIAGILLSQCRSELSETLDDLSAPPVTENWRPFGWLRQWMALRPAWSGALLVFFGLLLGTQITPWLQSFGGGNYGGQAVNVIAGPKLTDDQLSNMTVAGFSVSPSQNSAPGTMQVKLSAEQPLVLSGNVDDPDMRRVLTYIVENGDRTHADVRLDCLEALKARARDFEVRRALLTAARRDENPAVRMKAFESLRDAAADQSVRDALLEALQKDTNPGVRVEAVNLLVHSLDGTAFLDSMDAPQAPESLETPEASAPADSSLERVVRALEELRSSDPSRYVRLRSAAALRQIGPRDVQ